MTADKIICVSGGADPLTSGHLDMIDAAYLYGKVYFILNSDEWLIRKKGYCFMSWQQRYRILMAIDSVEQVVHVDDSDNTVCEALRYINPDYFANGGDRKTANFRENAVCEELGIKQLFNIGGGKTTSSSDLVMNAARTIYAKQG